MSTEKNKQYPGTSRQAEEANLSNTLAVIHHNIESYGCDVRRMRDEIDDMVEHFHDDNPELINTLENTVMMYENLSRALERNERARKKPYFGRLIFHDESLDKEESLYIGRGGISKDATNLVVIDWRAPVANAYYENGLGKCSYNAPDGKHIDIDLKLKRTYEIENGQLQNYFDTEVISNDDLLTKYLSKNKQAVLGEIVATIQREQNDIIRRSPYHNVIVQGVAGSGKTTVAMHRISYILYNYAERFKPADFYIVGSNRILLNYITGVLPDLDVYGIRQMTMEQLFVRLLYEDWDEQKYSIKSTVQSGNSGALKGSLSWFQDLERFCETLEWNTICRESIYLNPRRFVEGFKDGKAGVYDRTDCQTADQEDLILLVDGETVEQYIRQNPTISVQSKIDMLNERLRNKIKDEFLGKVKYTEHEKRAILKAYRGKYGASTWKTSIYDMYLDFLTEQAVKGNYVDIPDQTFDVYDLAALAYLYKRIKETEVISEAHHVVIDEAQDFGMMAYSVLKFCMKDCTYTIMGDVSQNIHFGHGLNDWEALRQLYLSEDDRAHFDILKKSYRNTVEISNFATKILHHGNFPVYPVEPIIRHGNPVEISNSEALIVKAAEICKAWQAKGLSTIAVICRSSAQAAQAANALRKHIEIMESNLETAEFGNGILVLPVEYTKGLEFDAVLILEPTKEDYPVDNGHAKLLYVAATRALHELCVLHAGNITGLITDPILMQADNFDEKSVGGVAQHKVKIQATAAKAKPRASVKQKPAAVPVPTVFAKPAADKIGVIKPKPAAALKPKAIKSTEAGTFGDIPATELLRPAGHTQIASAVMWMDKQADGLYLHSRYGVLRISPVDSNIVRITFAKGSSILSGTHPKIRLEKAYRVCSYKDTSKVLDFMTGEIYLQVDKTTGAIRYMTRDKKLLLSEKNGESRQVDITPKGLVRSWLYLDWAKSESICGVRSGLKPGTNLRGSTRYISHGENSEELPFLISDKGYGILVASDGPTFVCDVPTYGSYLYTERAKQLDYYFITGNDTEKLLAEYARLCGK